MNIYSKIPFVKLCENLFLRENVIVSYTSEVGEIIDGFIHTKGKYSRTTTKHISTASDLLGKGVIWKDAKIPFFQYQEGVRIGRPANLLKPATGKKMIQFMKEGWSFAESALIVLDGKVGGEDRLILSRYIDGLNLPESALADIKNRRRAAELIF
jgi:hypothetical protein